MGTKNTEYGTNTSQHEKPIVIMAEEDNAMDIYKIVALSGVADVRFARDVPGLQKVLEDIKNESHRSIFAITDPTGFMNGWSWSHTDALNREIAYVHSLDDAGVVTFLVGANREAFDKALFSKNIIFCELRSELRLIKELRKELLALSKPNEAQVYIEPQRKPVVQAGAGDNVLRFQSERRGGSEIMTPHQQMQ